MTDELRRYADKQEIVELLNARALGADRFDPDLMRACHPPDATDNHGTAQGLMYDFITSIEQRAKSGPPCRTKQHVVMNPLFDFRAGGEVFVESLHVAHEVFEEERGITDYHIGGRYLDLFRRVNGRWLIRHRDVVYDWSRVMPATAPVWPAAQPASLRGVRSPADPLYAVRPAWRGRLPVTPSHPETDIMDAAVQQLLDKQAIAEVLYRRARAGDRADAELAHTCYHPGATERHGTFDGLATEFIDLVSFTRPKPGSPIRGMLHIVTNILCDFDDETHAFVECYHVAWVQMTNGDDAVIGGRYLDRFEKRDERWAIVHRDVIFDWSRIDPETEKFWDRHPAAAFLFGRRGEDDPLYGYIARGT